MNDEPTVEKLKIIELLEPSLDNFAGMSKVITDSKLTTGTIFLPEATAHLSDLFNRDASLCVEAITFLDVIKIYSFMLYGDGEYFINNILDIMYSNRYVVDEKKLSQTGGVYESFLLSDSKEEFKVGLIVNRFFIAIYVLCWLHIILDIRTKE